MTYHYGTPEHELELIEWERNQPEPRGEFADLTQHELMQILGGDCNCTRPGCLGDPERLAAEERDYYRYLRAEQYRHVRARGIPALQAWDEARAWIDAVTPPADEDGTDAANAAEALAADDWGPDAIPF